MEYVNLGDVATYINGYAFKPEHRGKKGLPIIRIQDLNGNSHDLAFFDGKYPEQVEINTGDILISWSGSLGVYKWNKGKALLNQHIFKVLFNKIEIDKEYFCYAIRNSLSSMSQQTHGATMKHITKKDFDNISIPYPDLIEQKKIANNLNIVNKLIMFYEKELILFEQMVKARFIEMFGDPITNSRSLSTNSLKDTLILKAGDFTEASNIFEEYSDVHPYPCYGGNGVRGFVSEYNQDGEYSLIGRQGALSGNVQFVAGKFKNTEHALLVTPLISMNSIWLNQLLINLDLKRYQTGAAQPGISVKNLQEIQIIMVPIAEQNKFANFVKQVDKSRFDIKKSITELEREVVYD